MNFLFAAAIAVAFAAFVPPQSERGAARPKIVEKSAFTVIGISARTTNAKEMSGHGVIGKMWQRVATERLLEKIPNRIGSDTLALYTDYESDANGAYTFVIGVEVKSVSKIPAGMVAVKVPAAKYAVFTSARGPVEKVVPETWGRIWGLSDAALGGKRAYKTDFELYDRRAADPQNALVEVYVGIK